ncbi:MAG: hypothetical protein AB1499_12710 [Nitrospirota bacterium]
MDKLEFLKYSVDYIENKINRVDNKANILIAIEAGLFGISTFLMDKLFLSKDKYVCESILFLSILFLLTTIIIGYLLQTLRPSTNYLSHRAGIIYYSEDDRLMWPTKRSFDKERFKQMTENLNDKNIMDELNSSLFVAHQLVTKKYSAYRTAVLLTKYQLIITLIGLILFLKAY